MLLSMRMLSTNSTNNSTVVPQEDTPADESKTEDDSKTTDSKNEEPKQEENKPQEPETTTTYTEEITYTKNKDHWHAGADKNTNYKRCKQPLSKCSDVLSKHLTTGEYATCSEKPWTVKNGGCTVKFFAHSGERKVVGSGGKVEN